MSKSFYRDKWQRLQQGPCRPEELTRLARQTAFSFLDTYLKNYCFEEEYINLLCEMTTFFQNPQLNIFGSQALFGIIIESLCDDFEELQTITYNKVMAQVISYCRSIAAGNLLDQKLNDFGITCTQDLIQRIERIRGTEKHLPSHKKVSKIIVLSRVTIGADVAITSIILQRMKSVFPHAEIVLIGKEKAEQIYAGHEYLTLRYVPYTRNGDLLERLSSWHEVLDIIEDELRETPREETILIDPDSRLSQLGVLPLVSEDKYYFFDSRSDKVFMNKYSMPELVNAWLDQLLVDNEFYYPRVWLSSRDMDQAESLCSSFYQNGAQRIAVVNFGYGGNPRKRVGAYFEVQLILDLLKEPDTVVILDRGFGVEEAANTEYLLKEIQKQGYPYAQGSFAELPAGMDMSWGV